VIPCLNGATTMPYDIGSDILYSSLAGFHGVEILIEKLENFLEKYSKEDLKRFLGEVNISAPSICCLKKSFLLQKFDEKTREILEVGRFIGSKYLAIRGGLYGKSFHQAKDMYVSRLRELSSIIDGYNMNIAFEWIGEMDQAIDIVNTVNRENIGLLIDTFYWYKYDNSLDSLRKIPLDKIFFIHICDCEDLPREKLEDKHRVYCGLGVIPLIDILKILDEKGYRGYLSVEIFREEYWREDPQLITINAYDMLIGVGLEAGVRII